MLKQQKHLAGVHPHDYHKNTRDMEPQRMPLPALIRVPLALHSGIPCTPTVQKGDLVKVGQMLGNSEERFGTPVHSSVSGEVVGLDAITYLNGIRATVVSIKTDQKQTIDESVKPPVVGSHREFVAAIRNSGLVGQGGAGFPTHIKLYPKDLSAIDTLLVNAAECEPFITSDYRTMLDRGEAVIEGIKTILHWLAIPNCVVGIEDNKPEAIAHLTSLAKDSPEIKVVALATVYPRGAEKVLLYETTGRVIPQGKLPADVGALVLNVTSVAFIAEYMKTGLPLVEKTITVDGSAVKNPANVIAPIGTSVEDLIGFCGGYSEEPGMILMGGPMMGITLYTDDYPVIKLTNAILVYRRGDVALPKITPCIKCGRCSDHCPVGLMPFVAERALERGDVDDLKSLEVGLCFECGCCSYICPAKRPLVLAMQLSKQKLREAKK